MQQTFISPQPDPTVIASDIWCQYRNCHKLPNVAWPHWSRMLQNAFGARVMIQHCHCSTENADIERKNNSRLKMKTYRWQRWETMERNMWGTTYRDWTHDNNNEGLNLVIITLNWTHRFTQVISCDERMSQLLQSKLLKHFADSSLTRLRIALVFWNLLQGFMLSHCVFW